MKLKRLILAVFATMMLAATAGQAHVDCIAGAPGCAPEPSGCYVIFGYEICF